MYEWICPKYVWICPKLEYIISKYDWICPNYVYICPKYDCAGIVLNMTGFVKNLLDLT